MKKHIFFNLMLLGVVSLMNASEPTATASATAETSDAGSGSASAKAETTSGASGFDAMAEKFTQAFGGSKSGGSGGISLPTGGVGKVGYVGDINAKLSILEKNIAEATNDRKCTTAEAKGETAQATVINMEGASNAMVGNIECSGDQIATASTTKQTSEGTAQQGKVGEWKVLRKFSAAQLAKNQMNLGNISAEKSLRIPLNSGIFSFKFTPAQLAQGPMKRSISVVAEIVPFTEAIANDEFMAYEPNQHILLLWARVEPEGLSQAALDRLPWKELLAVPFSNNQINKGVSIPAMAFSNSKFALRFDNKETTDPRRAFTYSIIDITQ